MIQIIVVAASVLLGFLLYPLLIKTYTRIVTKLYKNLQGDNKVENEEIVIHEKNEKPPIIGKSKGINGHSRTKATSDFKTHVIEKKEDTFASDTGKETIEMDISVPLDKIENPKEGSIDPEEEYLYLEINQDALLASGVGYDELITTGKVIAKDEPSDNEKGEAGRVLYENQSTDIVEQVIANDEKTLAKVNSLISFHVKKHNLETEKSTSNSDSENFENFDFGTLFR